MKNLIKTTGILAGITALSVAPAQVKAAEKKEGKQPNLLFIFADQYRRASLGFLGQDPVITPNIDALAKNGVYFSQAVSNHPLSSPFRGMLFTGYYPLRSGVMTNCNSHPSRTTNELRADDVCFTDVLAGNGYDVAYVGKWHLDAPPTTKPGEEIVWDTWCPPERRHGINFWYSYGTADNHNTPHYWATDTPADKPLRIDQWSPEHEADVITKYFKDNKAKQGDKPFAMFWAINPPHTSFTQVPDRYLEPYKGKEAKDVLNRPNVSFKANTSVPAGDKNTEKTLPEAPYYFAQVNGVDEQIGRILKALDESGERDNTIIIFTADHGEMLGSQGLMHKNIWFSEAYDIPLIVSYPKEIKPKTEDILISVPDYMPTILSFMGLKKDIPAGIEGRDLSGTLTGKAVVRPDYQLYFGSEPSAPWLGKRGFKDVQYTFAAVKNKGAATEYFLYDNANDPYQMKNIWGTDAALDKKMNAKLTTILTDMKDPWILR